MDCKSSINKTTEQFDAIVKRTEAREIVDNQIEMNNIALQTIVYERNINEIELQLIQLKESICQTKKTLIENLNEILVLQRDEYTAERQKNYHEIVAEINEVDNNTAHIVALITRRDELVGKIAENTRRYQELERQIPETQVVENIKLRYGYE